MPTPVIVQPGAQNHCKTMVLSPKLFVRRETALEKSYQNEFFAIESYASVAWTAARKSQANSPDPVANVSFPA
jgi:hypothetical protein